MFGMSQQQQVALIQQMAQLQLMNGMQKSPSNIAGGKQCSKNCNNWMQQLNATISKNYCKIVFPKQIKINPERLYVHLYTWPAVKLGRLKPDYKNRLIFKHMFAK